MLVRVLLADDQQLFLEGLRAILLNCGFCDVVGITTSGRQAVDLAAELQPDVVIMDVVISDLNGIDATRLILDHGSSIRVLGLTSHSDGQVVLDMLAAGASGYIVKDSTADELLRAIQTVYSGAKYLCPQIASLVINGFSSRKSGSAPVERKLARREREVIQLLAEGATSKEIADVLQMAVKTAETHRRNIMRKLDIHSVAELTKYAMREGLTSEKVCSRFRAST